MNMKSNLFDVLNIDSVLERFPSQEGNKELKADINNPAIRIYGRRFYRDQTALEYLAEFLMVFASPKKEDGDGEYSFDLKLEEKSEAAYWPKSHLPLKLFSFFSISKLETRHQFHRKAYFRAIEGVKEKMSGDSQSKNEAIRLLQSLLSGFLGIGKNRTWITFCFLPASPGLLANEITWLHHDAKKETNGKIETWDSCINYFDYTRNFLGRGGELLFLQLSNLFSEKKPFEIDYLLSLDEYKFLRSEFEISGVNNLQERIENGLKSILMDSSSQLKDIINFLEFSMEDINLFSEPKKSALGWVPKITKTEAFLFAVEIRNICDSDLGSLEKLDLLQMLCTMHVMRSLCFQGRRIDNEFKKTPGFLGNYVWIPADPDSKPNDSIRKVSNQSLVIIENMLTKVIRSPSIKAEGFEFRDKDIKNGDDNCRDHFIRFGKFIDLIVPPRGPGKRFSINSSHIRFLVSALLKPNERIRLTDFYHRVFAHYGIALGGEPLAVALAWCGNGQDKNYAIDMNTGWVEETLQQGGFLIELSDAVSIVHNPGSNSREWA
jgi:hypothetical protein